MNEPTDLDIRIAALSQEYETTIAAQARRSATLASELASTQAKLKTAEAKVIELTPKEPDKKADA
jgi:uncharacterized small protein (DUF1192 family)